jgi:hypothetical protein
VALGPPNSAGIAAIGNGNGVVFIFVVMGKRVIMGCGRGMWLLALNLYLMMSPPNTLQQGGGRSRCPTRTLWRGESANNVACKMGRPERRSDH